MGAPLLIVLAALLLAGCQPRMAADGDPHAGIACAGCHNGGRADFGRAAVPAASCTASGCHEDGGPRTVELATARFEHRAHGADADIVPSCAGCHTHPDGGTPLRASVDACAICHLAAVAGEEQARQQQECRSCHQEPRHVSLTSAGIPVPHASLPWMEIGCVRCHYDVADPPVEVGAARCAECHRDVREATRRGVGTDLHPTHAGLTCTACHASGTHHVRALSSAVSLVCSDCHTRAHDVALTPWMLEGGPAPWHASATCIDCHHAVHRPQQQLLLGMLPGIQEQTLASEKFLGGMTCRSCHVPPVAGAAPPADPIRGQAWACASCHGDAYRDVLDWWLEGLASRLRRTGAYVAAAERDLAAGSDSARAMVASAREIVALVREAGGQHNLELADRLFRESVRRTQAAYVTDGRHPPPAPPLGASPHAGLCSGCHYAEGPWDVRRMPRDFHEDLVRRREEGP
jgi:hypothetical protein